MTINSRAEGSIICSCTRAKGSDVFNTKCVNCESYIAETACFGLHSGTETCEQSSGGGKNFSLCHQLEGDSEGSMGPSHSTGVPHPFQGGASPNVPSPTLSVLGGANETVARGSGFLAGEGSSGDSGPHCVRGQFLLNPLSSAQDRRSNEASHKPESPQFLGSTSTLQDGGYPHATGDSSRR